MCDPISVIAGGSLIIGAAKEIVEYNQQKKQAKEVVRSAKESEHQQVGQLTLRQTQEMDAAGQSIMEADRQTRIAKGQAEAAAGEAGVTGASVDALLHEIQQQDLSFHQATNQNLSNTLDQLNAEKSGVRAETQSRINSAPFPSALVTGLNIAGRALDFGTQLTIRKSNSKK